MIASVIIRARNAERDLSILLPQLTSQHLPDACTLEIILVDNDSTDRTVAIAQRFGARVTRISTSDFTWGRALNRGIEAASGEWVVLLSSDVQLPDPHTLRSLLSELDDPQVVAAYGRQAAKADAPATELLRLRLMFPTDRRRLTADSFRTQTASSRSFCSNAFACFRRRTWADMPFDELLSASEEVPWLLAAMKPDDVVIYTPAAVALHSHRDPLLRDCVRVWEFHVKAQRARDRSPYSPLSLVSLLSRTAITAASVASMSSLPLSKRLLLVAILPAKLAMLLIVGLFSLIPALWHRVREAAWG